MARNRTCPKTNRQAEQHQRLLRCKTASSARTRHGNKRMLSLLACLAHSIHHVFISKTMAFHPLQLHEQALSKRRYPKYMGQEGQATRSPSHSLPPLSHFHRLSGLPVAHSSYSKSVSTRLFSSTPSSANAPTTTKTQYTIDDSVCMPTKEETLAKAVHKACRSLDVYMEKKPIAAHTKRAFEVLVEMIDEDQKQRLLTTSSPKMFEGIVLDSGCGTGRSTKLLSNIIHPKYLVIGVDRSLARLTKTKDNRRTYEEEDNDNNNIPSASKSASESEREAYCHKVSDNAYLVRAELVDFWRCCIEHGWTTTTPSSSDNNNKLQQENYERSGGLTITHHYMLYPNPYPTKARLSSRWYAHPSFPLILKLGIPKMVVRSNWEGYLREFARAVEMANDFYVGTCSLVCKGDAGRVSMDRNLALSYLGSAKKGPSERVDKSLAYTNFESKYDSVGERTFQLILERNDTNASN